ncbi:unnamed protein product [Ilex paraguariensis]|uniref:Uncharacterized protein n=1 Tax=Ilex paraguariensis TaxID=185542 RepID=A0ABC8S7Z7_9AQUA
MVMHPVIYAKGDSMIPLNIAIALSLVRWRHFRVMQKRKAKKLVSQGSESTEGREYLRGCFVLELKCAYSSFYVLKLGTRSIAFSCL